MSDSEKNMIDFSSILRKNGYNLPIDESEVEEFEKNLICDDDREPLDWDNPLKILERGKVTRIDLSLNNVDPSTINNLSMAAREGKEISKEVRAKMNDDRQNSRK